MMSVEPDAGTKHKKARKKRKMEENTHSEEILDTVMETDWNGSKEEEVDKEENVERTAIRAELSTMSFEELQHLKEQMGSKLYNEAMFGNKSPKTKYSTKESCLKRTNSKRPRKMSAKTPVSIFQQVVQVNRRVARDPRFEDLCGTYNEAAWKNAYYFLDDMQTKEHQMLKEQLQEEEEVEKKDQLKYLIQRMENQQREEKRRREKEEEKKEEQRTQIDMLREGKNPHYVNKVKKSKLELASRFHSLKSSGRLDKYMKKRRKKLAVRDRKALPSS